eukprot:TRINITY_DN574_c0_g1_i1.p1 TRINITY_DN574_c0_g1~~TRINITY_DN574_c0_g1_i1.p1  ORF type:complete len:1038 (+),score=322.06 TRINITY_DN574_c0_g1_i1:3422-6535(+)
MRFIKATNRITPPEAFTVVRILGRGSGVIVSLIENGNGERFTLKTISKKSKFYNAESVKQEIAAGQLLDHPSISALIRDWEDDDNVYLLMEKTEGTDLITLLESRAGVPLSENLAKQILLQVVHALEHAHTKDISHLGITLDGILLDSKDALNLNLPDVSPIRRLNQSTKSTTPSTDIPIIMKEARSRLKKEIKEEEKLMKDRVGEWKKLPTIHSSFKKRYPQNDQQQIDQILSEEPFKDGWVEMYKDGKWEHRKLKLTENAVIVNCLNSHEKRFAQRSITRADSQQSKDFRVEVKEVLSKKDKSTSKRNLGEFSPDSECNDVVIFLSEISSISHRDSTHKTELGFNLNIFVISIEGLQPIFFRTNSLKETLQWILHIDGMRQREFSQNSQNDALLSNLFRLDEHVSGKISCASGDNWIFKKNSTLKLVDQSCRIEYQWNGRIIRPTENSMKLGMGVWNGFKLNWFYSSDSHVIYSYTWNPFLRKFLPSQNVSSLQYELGKIAPVGGNQDEEISHDPQIPLPVIVSLFILKRMKVQLENHSRLGDLLISEDGALLSALCDANSSSGTDPLAQSLTAILEKKCQTLQVLDFFMGREVELSQSSGTLFRANDPSSRIVRFYLKYLGFDWIESIFGPIISRLVASNFECEVDPIRLDGNSNIDDNMERLIGLTQEFFDAIVKNLDRCPPQITALCACIGMKVKSKFPEHTLSAMGGFFFLRYLCPALVQPAAFGLINKNAQVSPTILRALILSAKILQNLSNRVNFGEKENYLTRANAFIHRNTLALDGIFERILKCDAVCRNFLDIASDVVIVSMETIQNSMVLHIGTIEGKLAGKAELLSRLQDYMRDAVAYPPMQHATTKANQGGNALKRVRSLPHRFQNFMRRAPSTLEDRSEIHPSQKLHSASSIELYDDQAVSIKLFDFRTCKIGPPQMCTDQTTPIEYCAPEICSLKRNETYNGCAADVWSLGVVIYGLLFGRFPIPPSGYRDLNQGKDLDVEFPGDISADAKDLLQRMFCADATKRIGLNEIKNHDWLKVKQ